MASDGLMPALAVLTEASATDNSSTIQGFNLHLRNHSNQDYIPKVGSHLSSEELGSMILRVEVGSGNEPGGTTTFRIHYKLLCDKIPMFKESFGDSFEQIAEPDCQIIPDVVLVNDDPSAFRLLAGWLYMDTIDGDFDKSASSSGKLSPKGSFRGLIMSMRLPIYIKLCILAELYEITRLENEAINFLIKFMIDTKTRPNPSCWLEVYKQTNSRSALRVLFCRIAVWQLSQNGSDDAGTMDLESILCRNEELRRDIESLKDSNEGDGPADPFLAPDCDYHNHGPVFKCPCPRR
ncbi:hypothetical protein EYC80_010303 [Monilinia laxa]|uniref:BTB domain-containing protein n=1 Tax=Monilinia laxa TaxID=61186 RepID=A0A5N6JNC1_MONLA|nr:hypothetical protein EYC80_010303 [Monilinia laxa]